MNENEYRGSLGIEFQPFSDVSYDTIEPLQCLHGKLWDARALALVHALRPSYLRVTEGEIKCDSRLWRVTVYINMFSVIERIEQEVEVGLLED